MKCAVQGCTNCTDKQLKHISDITFHQFPSNPEIKNAWVRILNTPSSWYPTKYSKICSNHFNEEDFYKTKNGYKKLRQGVLPKLDIPNWESATNNVAEGTAHTSNCQVGTFEDSEALHLSMQSPVSELKPFLIFHDTPRKKALKQELYRLKIQNMKKNKKIRQLLSKNSRLKKKVASIQALLNTLQKKNLLQSSDTVLLENINIKAKELMQRQQNKIFGKPLKQKYSVNLRTFALTLNFYSPKAYDYVRRTFDTCLPHQRTLAKWYQTVDGKPGFTEEAFNALKQKTAHLQHPIFCNLVLDEMAIRRHVEWDGSKYYGYVDTGTSLDIDTLNKATQVLVLMLVGVNVSWKLPVGFFFIDSVTGEQRASLVQQCLINTHNTGVKVVGLTMDGCPSNLSMAKILGCSFEFDCIKTSFKHPCSSDLIYCFLDACHMIKLIRNAFEFNKTLYDYQGNTIEWRYLVDLNVLQKKETLNLGNKLTDRHINFHREKMKVKLASQLFSTSVANALESCRERHNSFKDASGTIVFIKLFNDLFDILNSKNLKQYGSKKALFEGNFSNTLAFLTFAKNYILHLATSTEKIIRSRRKTGFIGIIVCIESATKLYLRLVQEQKALVYLPLYKFSQDHLELFFGNIRAHGRANNNPTARQFQAAYKKTLINTELKDSFRGSCIPLENIGILSCSSRLNPIDLINYTSERSRIANVTPEADESIFDDALLENNKALDSQYSDTTQIVSYIAGYIVRALQKNIKCEECSYALHSSEIKEGHQLISLKTRGRLIFPSDDVVKICLRTENVIRKMKKESLNAQDFKPFKIVNTTLKSFIGEDYFKSLYKHSLDQCPTYNHVTLLAKAISQKYCNIRFRYYSKLENITLSKRQHFNKTILFSGQ